LTGHQRINVRMTAACAPGMAMRDVYRTSNSGSGATGIAIAR